LVIFAGLISVLSELSNQLKKQAEKNTETQKVMEQLNGLQKKQDDLNRISDQLSRRVEESLLLLRQSQGDSQQRCLPPLTAAKPHIGGRR